MNENLRFYRAYRRMLGRLKRAGDIVDYKVRRDGDTVHAEIELLPALDSVSIDGAKYAAAIDEIVEKIGGQ